MGGRAALSIGRIGPMRLTGILLVLAVLAAFFAPASRTGAAVPLPSSPAGAIAASAAERFVIVPAESQVQVREAVRPTTFAVTLKLERNTLTGLAAATVLMTDFGFEPPSIFGILRAQNEVKLEFRFVARKESP